MAGAPEFQFGEDDTPQGAPEFSFDAPEKPEPTIRGAAVQPFHGFNVGLRNIVGAPVDIANWTMRKTGLPVSDKPFMGSEWVKERMGDIGVRPEEYPAQTGVERALRAGGEGVAYALAPQMALEATATRAAPTVARGVAEKLFGASRPGSSAATAENIALNLGAGAGAEVASENVPDRWKGVAGMAGGVGGAGLTQAGIGIAKGIPTMARGAFDYMQLYWNPKVEAARQLSERATNPSAATNIIEEKARELIPGSKPTTFEVTGDPGIGQMQRAAETQSPERFLERRGEQAIARQTAIEGVAPSGSPMDVPAALKQQFNALEASENAIAQAAEARTRQAIDALGGNATPDEYGRLLRQYTQEAKDAANAARKALYDAVDPRGDLNAVSSGIRDAATSIASTAEGSLAKPLEGEVASIVDAAKSIGDVLPFSELRNLDTRIGDAMRQELRTNGETNTYRQLAELKRSSLDAINNAAENQTRYEAEAVASGKMNPRDTLEARLRSAWGMDEPRISALEPNMTPADVEAIQAAKKGHQEYVEKFREGPVGEVLRPGQSRGNYRLEFDASVGPKFFQPGPKGFEAAEAFKRAAGGNPDAMATMNDYIVAQAFSKSRDPKTGLIDPKRFDAWKAANSDALRAFPDAGKQLSSAARASEAAMEVAARARDTIKNAQGSEIAKVMGAGDDETVSKVVGGIFGRSNAQGIMRDLVQATKNNPDARQGLQRSVADYIRQRFVSTAEAGTSDANLINSATFQKFVRDNRKTLEQVLDKDQVNTLQALADDLNRSARSVTGSALAGRPTTAQDMSAAARKGQTYWDKLTRGIGAVAPPIISGGAMGYAGGPIAGLVGFGAVTGAEILGGMRAAGMKRVDDLITEAILNPELARQLLKAAPKNDVSGPARTLSDKIAKLGFTGVRQPIQGNSDQSEEAPPLTINGPGNRMGRATGGAVNLTALAKSARKHVTLDTKPLLGEHDETVARALEIAGKHI